VSVRVRELDFGYETFRLHVRELAFAEQKVTCIVGRNGAGKSTLLKCLAGILPFPKRSLFWGDRDLASVKGRSRAGLISYVPQEPALALNYSVLDFVLMGRASFISPFAVPGLEDIRLAHEALRYVGLGGLEDREYSRLSGGERRLVLIARTLAQNAEILLLDEPTTFLDPKNEVDVMDICRRLAVDRKRTIIITLHNLEMAVKYSDRLVFMKKGEILAGGTTAEVLDERLLAEVFDIPISIVNLDGRKLVVR